MKKIFSNSSFSARGFVSLLLTFAALLMTLSSLVLYVLPHGRISYWNAFTLLGLDKDQWSTIHVIAGFSLLIAVGFHLVYNWKPFVNYLKTKRNELLAALILTLVFLLGSAAQLPPFSCIMELGETMKMGWEAEPPPAPHFEFKTIRQIAQEENTPLETLVEKVNELGLSDVSGDESLQELSAKAGLSPAVIYKAMDGKRRKTKGMGKKQKKGDLKGKHWKKRQ